jgi:hypothetical protein
MDGPKAVGPKREWTVIAHRREEYLLMAHPPHWDTRTPTSTGLDHADFDAHQPSQLDT